jgi:hypothetical protein
MVTEQNRQNAETGQQLFYGKGRRKNYKKAFPLCGTV